MTKFYANRSRQDVRGTTLSFYNGMADNLAAHKQVTRSKGSLTNSVTSTSSHSRWMKYEERLLVPNIHCSETLVLRSQINRRDPLHCLLTLYLTTHRLGDHFGPESPTGCLENTPLALRTWASSGPRI